MVEEFDDIDSHDSDTSESIESTLPLAEPINNHGEQCSQDKPSPRVVCEFCGYTYVIGETCIRCQQNEEFQASMGVDSAKNPDPVTVVTDMPEEEVQPPTLDDIRRIRVAHFVPDQPGRAHDVTIDSNLLQSHVPNHDSPSQENATFPAQNASSAHNTAFERDEDFSQQDEPGARLLVHRSCIVMDMIKHFKDEIVMNCQLTFQVINERGQTEDGVGVGVNREVFCLFWNAFSNSMTIGETERVPSVRHDHFVEEWGAVGRILVKGFTSVAYFPMFLSKAFICCCLFGTEVPKDIILNKLFFHEVFVNRGRRVNYQLSREIIIPRGQR